MTNFNHHAWNLTQSLRNALIALHDLRSCVPEGSYDVVTELDHLELDLEASLARAQTIIQRLTDLKQK